MKSLKLLSWARYESQALQDHIISSYHMEKTEAGLKGLCIQEMVTK